MKDLQTHIRTTVQQNLRPDFTARVLRTVQSQGDRTESNPLIALTCTLAVCCAAFAFWPRAAAPVQLNSTWEEIVFVSSILEFHL